MSSARPGPPFQHRGGLEVLTWPHLDRQDVDAVVTTRRGGVSEGPYESLNLGLHVGDDHGRVLENRRRAAGAVGLSLGQLVFCEQAHGRAVAVVSGDDRGRGARSREDAVPEADALVTATSGVGLVVMVADCVPIVLVDPEARVLACVHAGWRGTTAGVVPATLGVMATLGAAPGRVLAAIGPAIPADRYQVGEEVVDAARTHLGQMADDVVRPDGTGRWRFDLWAANERLLVEAGVAPANVAVTGVGTGAGSPFFSDRAERPCGRFAAIAALHRPGR